MGPRVTKAYGDMGVIAFGDINMEELGARDEAVAEEFDAKMSQHNGVHAAK